MMKSYELRISSCWLMTVICSLLLLLVQIPSSVTSTRFDRQHYKVPLMDQTLPISLQGRNFYQWRRLFKNPKHNILVGNKEVSDIDNLPLDTPSVLQEPLEYEQNSEPQTAPQLGDNSKEAFLAAIENQLGLGPWTEQNKQNENNWRATSMENFEENPPSATEVQPEVSSLGRNDPRKKRDVSLANNDYTDWCRMYFRLCVSSFSR